MEYNYTFVQTLSIVCFPQIILNFITLQDTLHKTIERQYFSIFNNNSVILYIIHIYPAPLFEIYL